MPTHLHEALVEVLRLRPHIVLNLLPSSVGVDLPPFEDTRTDSAEFTDLIPTQFRADAVVVLTDGTGPVFALIIEAQLAPDRRKHWTWPVYLTSLRARLECPTALVVVSADARTASWAARPIDLGHPALRLVPMVVGPGQPPAKAPAAARTYPWPGSAKDQAEAEAGVVVLRAIIDAQGDNPDFDAILRGMLDALQTVDPDLAANYSDIAYAAMPEAGRSVMEDLLTSTYTFRGALAEGYVKKGKAEGEATALLQVLEARGVDVPAEAGSTIRACTDVEQLSLWIRRAVSATTIEDVLKDS